jgi:hypothetical protein
VRDWRFRRRRRSRRLGYRNTPTYVRRTSIADVQCERQCFLYKLYPFE